MTKTVVCIHGTGYSPAAAQWLEPIERGLARLLHPHLSSENLEVIGPSYVEEISTGGGQPLPDTWVKPNEERVRPLREKFSSRREALARMLDPMRQYDVGPGLPVPEIVWEAGIAINDDARRYRWNTECRHAAQRRVLEHFPRTGRIILIGYSLGSVLAVDLLTKLPENLEIDLLLTVGSPLAIQWLGVSPKDWQGDFPYDRVGAWVNVYDPYDKNTTGRGISSRYAQALDVPINIHGSHALEEYLSHGAVATLLGSLFFGADGSDQI